MDAALVVLVLSLLLGLQPVATDLYLPALPSLTAALGATMAQAQLTLSALLLAFGISQLVWGPVSDRFGRRPVLLIGVATYTVASAGSVLAGTIESLVLWRILQGAAMGAAVMCARALVRDLYSPELGARAISKGLSGLGVVVCVCMPLGGVLAEWLSWRVVLAVQALFAGTTLWILLTRFHETLARPNPHALQPGVLWRTWRDILRNRVFRAYALLTLASYAGLFTFLAASSFVFISLMGMSRIAYGGVMLVMAVSYLAGTFLCRRLLPRLGVHRTVLVGGGLSLVGGMGVGVVSLAGGDGPVAILLPFVLYMLGHGIHQPCGQSGAIGPFPQAAGAASAMSGLLMMLAAFATGAWLGVALDGTRFALTNGLWFWGVITAAVAWGLVWRTRGG